MSGGRRKLLALLGGAVAALGLSRGLQAANEGAAAGAKDGVPANAGGPDGQDGRDGRHGRRHQAMQEAVARQEIKELRHAYGIATDRIGSNTEEGIAEGRAIYRRIFTAGANIGAAGVDPVTGPDAWVDVVKTALAPYNATQHLIGTQHVTDLVLPGMGGTGGKARISSYLQAWHSKADGQLWLFMGTYDEDVVYTPGTGWQIERMLLRQIAADYRQIRDRPPEA